MDIRTDVCFELSRRLMARPERKTVDYGAYSDWRHESLTRSWSAFSDSSVTGKDVLDFGCGDGQLTFFLALHKHPRKVIGVDISSDAIARCDAARASTPLPGGVTVEFAVGSAERLPVPDASIDTLIAFDCLEHVMSPAAIVGDWYRVLRPGGRVLIEWFPYTGPWGPHMEPLIPIPWAHVIFGERAMFRAAERIYDLPEFMPRYWDLDETGRKRPNKWRAWSSFREQGFINQLDVSTFRRLALEAGFEIPRLVLNSFSGSAARRFVGRTLMRLPAVGKHFVSFTVIELQRPR